MQEKVLELRDKLKGYEPGDLVSLIEIENLCREILDTGEISSELSEIVSSIQKELDSSLSGKTAYFDEKKICDFIELLNSNISIDEKGKGGVGETSNDSVTIIKRDEIDVFKSFIRESLDHLDGIEENILKLETDFDREIVNSVFRPFHTIKGTSSYLGLKRIKNLSHSLETLLDKLREGVFNIDSEIVDVLLEGVDSLNKILTYLETIIAKAKVSENETTELEIDESRFDFSSLLDKIEKVIEERVEKEEHAGGEKTLILPEKLKNDFIVEAHENLSDIEDKLIELEKNPSKIEFYDSIFRALHTLKGNAGLLLSSIPEESRSSENPVKYFYEIAHKAENTIQSKRDEGKALTESEVDALLKTLDSLNSLLDCLEKDVGISGQLKEVIDELLKGSDKPNESNADKKFSSSMFQNILLQSIEAISGGIEDLKGEESPDKVADKIERGLENLLKLARKVSHINLLNHVNEGFNIVNELRRGVDKASQASKLERILSKIRENGDRRQQDKKAPGDIQSRVEVKASQVLKVPEERIDLLLKQVMELSVNSNNLREIDKELRIKGLTGDLLNDIHLLTGSINKTTEELQSIVMAIRLVPLNTIFSRFHRLVRDLSKKLGKKVQLVVTGEDTELDKTVIDLIGDPLVHIIRNCIDHGIESPYERTSNGKKAMGTIKLSAYSMGQNVIIDIEDDGKGIDIERIKLKAIEKNLVNREKLETASKDEILNLIFMPGFSTAKEVSDVSGRGVGMDVVKTNIEKIGGTVGIKSEKGKGTTVSLRIPITLAINRGLEIEVQKEHYYIPLDYVLETVKVPMERIKTFRNKKMVVIREELYQLKELYRIFGNDSARDSNENEEIANLVILSVNGQKLALMVDKFYGEGEYMIRPLPKLIETLDIFSGVTITGRGKILLVLDPLKFI